VFIFLDPPYWRARKFPLYGKKGDLNKYFDHEQFAANVREAKTFAQRIVLCIIKPAYIQTKFHSNQRLDERLHVNLISVA